MTKTFLVFSLIFGIFSFAARSDEMDKWYGTFTVEQKFHSEKTETFTGKHPYAEGTRITTSDRKISGTIRYIPGFRITSGVYTNRDVSDRKSHGSTHCRIKGKTGNTRDYEYSDFSAHVAGSLEQKSKPLSIYVGDDGKYRITQGWILPADPKGLKITRYRETYDGCSSNPLKRKDDNGVVIAPVLPAAFMAEGIAKELPPQTLSGEFSTTLQDGTEQKISWNLTRAVPKLTAIISGPPTFFRGETITLDASRSTGDITEYTWRFGYGDDCTGAPANADVELKTREVRFRALCSFKAYLTLKDSAGNGDSDTMAFTVKPREGDAWRTKFNTKPGENFRTEILLEHIKLGANRCAKHPVADDISHFLHKSDDKSLTWMDDAYTPEQISDGGPFSGMWFVGSQKLEIDRHERINASLLGASVFYSLNEKKSNLNAVQTLTKQVKAHEKMHSTLLHETMIHLGPQGDPATKIEEVIAPSLEILQTFADMKIRDVEGVLLEATSEANVKQRLSTQSAFQNSVKIWFPKVDGGEFFKDMGPLWAIGD